MAKMCVACEENEAVFCVKGSSECYCEDCAHEYFGDIGMLVKIEQNAELLKKFIEAKIDEKMSDSKDAISFKDDDDLINVTIKKTKDKKACSK